MNNIEQLRDKISAANAAYRAGTPVMSDLEFDALLESYQKQVSASEYEEFRSTLHEAAGKVKHPFIMGSLTKMKYEDAATVEKFINEWCAAGINISAKVDGISCRLHYENGKLVSASTRGNGYFGEDITDKIKFVKCVPKVLGTGNYGDKYKNIDIRGELVILKDDFAKMAGFANARNACAGLINRKEYDPTDIKNVTFVAYTILGKQFEKEKQFALLESWGGFNVAWNINLPGKHFKDRNLDVAESLFTYAVQDLPYETDGLVVCSSKYINEDKYCPDGCKAFKINQLIGETTLIDVVFEGPGKDGTHAPVGILEPLNLGGSMISRVSLHNLDIIQELGLKYGCVVKICKSGDVIPHILSVVKTNPGAKDIELPAICNCCQTPLVRDGVNLRCPNNDCSEQRLTRLYYFLVKLGVKHAAKKTLSKFGMTDFDKLLAWRPNKSKKTDVFVYNELLSKVFSRSKQDLLAALNCRGLAETSINKIVDFYGYDNVVARNFVGLPSGIGELTLSKFKESVQENLEIVNKLINDSRYNYTPIASDSSGTTSAKKNGMSVCFTGKLNTMSRGEAEKKAVAAGFDLKGVNKSLTYLVTNDTESGSSKNRKAKELGIKVITEEEFLKMIANSDSSEVFDL